MTDLSIVHPTALRVVPAETVDQMLRDLADDVEALELELAQTEERAVEVEARAAEESAGYESSDEVMRQLQASLHEVVRRVEIELAAQRADAHRRAGETVAEAVERAATLRATARRQARPSDLDHLTLLAGSGDLATLEIDDRCLHRFDETEAGTEPVAELEVVADIEPLAELEVVTDVEPVVELAPPVVELAPPVVEIAAVAEVAPAIDDEHEAAVAALAQLPHDEFWTEEEAHTAKRLPRVALVSVLLPMLAVVLVLGLLLAWIG